MTANLESGQDGRTKPSILSPSLTWKGPGGAGAVRSPLAPCDVQQPGEDIQEDGV
jgi:hypothetical protein